MSAPARCWIALEPARPADADAAALVRRDGAEAGWLAAWRRSAKPVRGARRADPRIIDASGAAALVSIVWPDRDALALFDDPQVQGARRALLADAEPPDAVTTLLVDASRFAGAVTVRRGQDAARRLLDDPFARVAPAVVLAVEAGLLAAAVPLTGPSIERHGSDVPWPGGRFA